MRVALFQSKKAELETEAEVTARERTELQAVTELKAVEMEDLKKNFEQLQVFLPLVAIIVN